MMQLVSSQSVPLGRIIAMQSCRTKLCHWHWQSVFWIPTSPGPSLGFTIFEVTALRAGTHATKSDRAEVKQPHASDSMRLLPIFPSMSPNHSCRLHVGKHKGY